MKGLNLIILIAFIAFVIAIVGLTLDFFHVFEEKIFILDLPEFPRIWFSITPSI